MVACIYHSWDNDQGLDNFSDIKKHIWIRRPTPGILTSNPVHGRINKTANVEKILMASLERIPCFHGLQRFLQPPWSSSCLSPHFCWRIHIKAKYLTRFLCLTNFLIKPKSSFPFSYRRFMCLPKGTICPWVFGSSKPPALILIVLKTEYTHTWNNYKGSFPQTFTNQTTPGPGHH